ncbi:MAG TPA: peptidylprolyl isomerase [Polyangiales bacterium]
MNLRPAHALTVPVLLALACGQAAAPKASEPAAPLAAAPAPQEAPPPAAPPGPVLEAPADPNEACGQILVVAYKGAEHAADSITRDKPAASARAQQLQKTAASSSDFAALAKENSDAPSSAPRGGVMGTYKKEQWPELFASIKEPLFALQVNETAGQAVEAPFGFVVVHRCKVAKAHGRHVLIRFKGAKKAGPEIKRSADDAKKLAVKVQQELSQGADFASIVKKYSEDASKTRGGDIGEVGRGLLAPAFEDALFALKVGELSTVVETEFGFHVIQRLPDEVAPIMAP